MIHSWKVGIWKEGKYFDLWHINHFLAGLLLGCLVLIFDMNIWFGFIVSLVLMLAWEIYELYADIHETKFNMLFDVIVAVIAFWLMVFLKDKYGLDSELVTIFWQSLIVYIFLELWGFRAYQIREKLRLQILRRAKQEKM